MPGFQDFRFSPAPATPKSCRMSLDGVEVWEGNALNVLEPGPLGLANIRNRQRISILIAFAYV
jgi:hypothetical protein